MIDKKLKVQKKITVMFGGFILMVFAAFFFGLVVMLLWNWLMPTIFGLIEVTYWQAWGIFLLAKILFGSRRVNKHYGDSQDKFRGRYDRKNVRAKFKKWLLDSEDEDNKPESSEP
jgi:hypothetical protein